MNFRKLPQKFDFWTFDLISDHFASVSRGRARYIAARYAIEIRIEPTWKDVDWMNEINRP